MGKFILLWIIAVALVIFPVGYWVRWILRPITKELREINQNLTRIRTTSN